jgi:hypothetical protein
MTGMERYRQLQPRIQGLLSAMEVPHSKRWHTGVPLGVRRRTV